MTDSDLFDVLVAGAGVGGICAAVAAARAGARVLLVEADPEIGGTGVHSPVALNCSICDSQRRYINVGLHREFFPTAYAVAPGEESSYDERDLKARYLRAIEGESRLTVWTATRIESAQTANGSVLAVETAGAHVGKVRARFFVDSTADGNLAAMAGAEWKRGRDCDGALQPATLTFVIEGVDVSKFRKKVPTDRPLFGEHWGAVAEELSEAYQKMKQTSGTSNPRDDVLFFQYPDDPSRFLMNATRIGEEGHKQIRELWSALKTLPAFENARIASISKKLGVREGRRIIGDYILTEQDCLGEARFDDMVAAGSYVIDIHNPEDGTSRYEPIPGSGYYHIPYRCLIAKGFRNLLMGSRCISGTHEAHGSYRVMSVVSAIGMAAGVAASLAAQCDAADCREVTAAQIRYELARQNQFVEGPVEPPVRAHGERVPPQRSEGLIA
jgi:choline dehydrogenase-like flavoprotein